MIAERTTLSATSGLNQRVRDLIAVGRHIAVLTAGEVGVSPPGHVLDAAVRAVRSGLADGYGPIAGEPQLREAIAARASRGRATHVDIDQVVVTNGAKHALQLAFTVLTEPGAAVLVPEPTWPTYAQAAWLAGARPVAVATDAANGFTVTPALLEAHAGPDVAALVLAVPPNPTGTIPTFGELTEIGRWCAQHAVTVLLDQIYLQLCWVPVAEPPAEVLRAAGARVVVAEGVSKSYAMAGWRVGWLIADPPAARAATAVMSHTTNHVNRVAQMAAAAALTGPQDFLESLRAQLLGNREHLLDSLGTAADLVRLRPPDGTFYAFPSFAPLLARAADRIGSGTDLARMLLEEAGVAVVPGAAFGAPDHARLSFVGGKPELATALERLLDFIHSVA